MLKNSPIPRATPESQGVASSAIAAFIDGVEAQRLNLHSFMLLRHGCVVVETWWRPFTADMPHILYSLTKSFTSTAAGFAITEGRLSLDDPVLSFFPRSAPRHPSEHLAALKVRHLLSMVTGHAEDPGMLIMQRPPREWVQAFFEAPLPYAPGAHFVYNSTASHMLSVIIHKVTGQKLINYLRDRLFQPLGIARPYWETDALGHNWGGWGLYLRTDEIARFGQMLLDHGQWQGQQVIPAAWVEMATSKQVPNGDDPNSDWAQGYGFQFWMSRHGFRGDGAFGQFCVVLRDQDLVFVTTAASPDMQAVLNVAWQTILPTLIPVAQADDSEGRAALQAQLADREIARPQGQPTSLLEGDVAKRTYRLADNALGWQSLRFGRADSHLTLLLETAGGVREIRVGTTDWAKGKLMLDVPATLPVAARGAWTYAADLQVAIVYLNWAAQRTINVHFAADALTLRTTVTGSFAPAEEIVIRGQAD